MCGMSECEGILMYPKSINLSMCVRVVYVSIFMCVYVRLYVHECACVNMYLSECVYVCESLCGREYE